MKLITVFLRVWDLSFSERNRQTQENIGGNNSHEFHVLASSGEDEIIFSTESDYAVSSELAKRDKRKSRRQKS